MQGIIIQARLRSTRLPGKVLLPFSNTSILIYLIERLRTLGLPIVVATTTSDYDDTLCCCLEENNIDYYRGSENNVLERFIETAERFNFSDIIRVCSDSPLIDIEKMRELMSIWYKSSTDYLSFSFNNVPTVLCHFGVFSEFTTLNALKKVVKNFENNLYYQEHVTSGIYRNPDLFSISLIELPSFFDRYQNIRITVDTPEDYQNLIYLDEKIPGISKLSFSNLAEIILKEDHIINRMRTNIEDNKKF